MEVYINGKQLHITKGEVTLNWANIRFSEAVADQWSTEIELPNDQYNIDLLNCYGLLDRGAIYNHKVICSVLVDNIAKDGYLQILDIDENTIKARVYINVIPYEVLDKKVCEYYPHDDVVFRWDRFSPITTNIAGVDEGIIPYDYTSTDFYSNILAQWHASVNVQKVLDNIQVAEDITLPAVYNTLYQLSSRKKVCPSNPYQVLSGMYTHSSQVDNKSLEMAGGQHISNDFRSSWTYSDFKWDPNYTDWDMQMTALRWMEKADKMDKLTFNRHVNAHIKIYATTNSAAQSIYEDATIQPCKNGSGLRNAAIIPSFHSGGDWDESDVLLFDFDTEFEKDDYFELKFWDYSLFETKTIYSVVIEYRNYEWGEDDYDTDLVYIPAPFCIWKMWTSGGVITYEQKHDFHGNGDGTNSPEDYTYTYFGAYTNLDREVTVREYLTSLCWIHNQKLKLDRNELIFQNANQREAITANLTTITPSSDKLGQTNIITYRDSDTPTQFDIDNEFLESEKVLHESIFYTGDVIPQYSYEMTYSEQTNDEGNQWITDINVDFEDFDAVLMTATQDGNRYVLKKAPDIVGFGLPALRNAQTITAQTLNDVSNSDYVLIDGHKYMIVSGQTDLDTYISTFTAIQCDSVFNLIPTIVINTIYTTGTTADVNFTVTGIFIQSTTLTIYGDNGHSQIVWQQHGTTADTQTMTVTGLTPNTFYWATVTATDAQGNEGESQTRQFKTAIYEFTGSVYYTGEYDTLHASVQVTCTGATFNETGIEFSTSPDFDGEIIRANNTTAPADTFNGNVAGFAEDTLYYFRYYAVSDFGTQYYTPTPNTITTRIAPPVLTITEVTSSSDTLTLSFLYSGHYPYDGYYSCVIGLADDSEEPVEINLDNLQPNRPEVVTVSGLQVGSEYVVSWDVNYYEDEVSAVEYFHTQAHNFDFECVIDSITDTTVRMSESATQITSLRLRLENIGINLYTSPDFDGRDMGGSLGEGGLVYRLRVDHLNEHTTYYYRPWIQTAEYGVEYGETNSFTTLYSRPTVTITEVSHSYDTITVNVNYTGNYPVPSNGILSLYLNGAEIQRLDASRLHQNGDTIFTFSNLDELTTYTITYTGEYYVEHSGITDTITATTGERINITLVTTWSVDGKCTQTISITSYEAITDYNVMINGDDITMVDDWTLNGTTIEGVSQGYDYNENPYSLDLVVTIGGGYTVTRSFNFSVPFQWLKAEYTYANLNSSTPFLRKIATEIGPNSDSSYFGFDLDMQNSHVELINNVYPDQTYTFSIYEVHRHNMNSFWIYCDWLNLPKGTYRGTWTLTNTVGQTRVTATTQNLQEWHGALFKRGGNYGKVNVTTNSVSFVILFNPWYDSYNEKHVTLILAADGSAIDVTPYNLVSGQTVTFNNLQSNTAYRLVAYFDSNANPVNSEALSFSTLPIYSIDSVTNITATSAIINISIS